MEQKSKLEQAKDYAKYLQDRITDFMKDLETTIHCNDNGIDLSEVRMYCNDICTYAETLNNYTKDCILTVIFDHNVDIAKVKAIDGVINVIDNDGEITITTKQCLKYQVLSKLHELGEMEYNDESI